MPQPGAVRYLYPTPSVPYKLQLPSGCLNQELSDTYTQPRVFPTNYSYRPGASTRSCPILIPNPECSLQTTVTVRVPQPGAVRYLYPTPSVPYKLQLPSGCLNQELSDTYTQPRVFPTNYSYRPGASTRSCPILIPNPECSLQTTVTVRVSQPGAVRYLYPTPSVPYKLQLPSGCLNQELSDTYTQPRVFPTNYSYRPGVSTRSCPILIPNPELLFPNKFVLQLRTVRVSQPGAVRYLYPTPSVPYKLQLPSGCLNQELSDTYTQPRVFPTNYSYRPGVSTRSCPILIPNPECSLQTTVTVRVPQPGAVRYLYPTPSVPYKLQLPSGCLNQELSDTYTQPRVFPTNYSYRPGVSTRSCPILIPNPECSLQTTVTVRVSQPGAVRYLYPTPSVPYKLQLPSGCLNQELSDTYTQPRVFPTKLPSGCLNRSCPFIPNPECTNYSYRPGVSTRSCPILIPNPECSLQTTVTVRVPQPGAVRYLYPTPSVPYKLQLPSGCLNQELSDTYTQPRVFPTNYSYRPGVSTRSCPILIPNPECSLQTTVTVRVSQPGAVRYLYPTPSVPYKLQLPSGCLNQELSDTYTQPRVFPTNYSYRPVTRSCPILIRFPTNYSYQDQELSDTYTQPRVFPTNYSYRPGVSTRSCPILIPNPECSLQTTVTVRVPQPGAVRYLYPTPSVPYKLQLPSGCLNQELSDTYTQPRVFPTNYSYRPGVSTRSCPILIPNPECSLQTTVTVRVPQPGAVRYLYPTPSVPYKLQLPSGCLNQELSDT